MTTSTDAAVVAAVDLGATSGRVMLGHVGPNELRLRPVARFANGPIRLNEDGHPSLHWNIVELYRNVLAGLGTAAAEEPALVSIGVDSWAVDYALLRQGRMLQLPYHYRDARTQPAVDLVHRIATPAELYAANGLQFLPFNTLYQLTADLTAGSLDQADQVLLVPDLLNYWLTGVAVAERTNASTTGLLGVGSREWDEPLIDRLGFDRRIFPRLVDAGTRIGSLLPDVAGEIGARAPIDVTAIGSHDTASAVVAVPALSDDFAYISCGTWGLVGVELEAPVLSAAGRAANFTNEGGVDGRVRYLHNVMGLWLLSESIRTWEHAGETIVLADLLRAAGEVTGPVAVFDADDQRFLAPGDMPGRIRDYCLEHDLRVPRSNAELVRSILESLADAFARGVETAAALSGTDVRVVHIVGGGSQNRLLCQLTADRLGLPVLAGPVEATAIGNVLVQARAQGLVTGSLEGLRALVARSFVPERYTPVRTLVSR
ncbi:rhamnulokinase [Cryobacterium sp. MDB1-18-2]|uniref:rhamnulokinase n=1 Tax=unclassified Cryobacterium TaxID=2649013 RepID=UPI001068F0A9|nr:MULTISPECIES: rhamnulokinase family protein [unclassified Cryobacterium]TFC35056.1 rhamnulokinase [Cryobacterium sp. MDB1-18-2]TFC42650.1 rhamnulokinase [Cryobacterium sp. MDB1-18-1]